MDIRKYIVNNFKDNSKDNIKEAIETSISKHDDITLPGIGVFFEIIWKNSNETTRNLILDILYSKFNN